MCNNMLPNMMPNIMPNMIPNVSGMQTFQMGMPFNNMNYNIDNNNDFSTRLTAIERQIRRLNDRITRLETINNNTYYNEKEEIDNSSMYMM